MPALPASAARARVETEITGSHHAARMRSGLPAMSGGGGNRTRVRGRTGQSIYKLRLAFRFARRPVDSRPTDGLATLKCRASGDWLSLGT